MKIFVIIPALDPDAGLLSLIDDCIALGIKDIIIVDDGSSCACSTIFDGAQAKGCVVLHHSNNLGKGAAIKTAVRYLNDHHCSYITADCDGQHLACDIALMVSVMRNYPHALILGVRNFRSHDIPWRSRYGNAFSSFFFRLSTGTRCCDTQTGLRGIPESLTDKLLSTQGTRYDFEMNFLTQAVKSGTQLKMVSIHTVYEDKNKCSHFHPLRDSFLIYKVPLTFALSSLTSAAADLAVFSLLRCLFSGTSVLQIGASTACARIFSGMINFLLNKKFSFSSHERTAPEAAKYLVLFIFQIILSSVLVSLLSVIPVPVTAIKCFVDTGLFFVSYFTQKYWVFMRK
ncbi:MAG: glycosyltransferase [Oscillospiraceae bacterium]|nr:glycosyltransferase [Oscillospiraceae bacterium]